MSSDKLRLEIIAKLLIVEDLETLKSINEQLITAGYDEEDELTEEQKAELLQIWSSYEKNPDDVLTPEELFIQTKLWACFNINL